MTTIDSARHIVTLINMFEVPPDRQDELVRVLDDATRDVMRHVPGFISANIHRSLDGTRVVNYAQWASQAQFESMPEYPGARDHMARAAQIATRFTPVLYEVASVHDNPAPRR